MKKTPHHSNTIHLIPRSELVPSPLNPRKHFDVAKLGELAQGIRAVGLINPLTVRVLSDGRKEILCGECRWRASGDWLTEDGENLPALVELPVIFRELDDADTLTLMLCENMQRQDLSPLEEADAFAAMLAQKTKDGKPMHTMRSLAQKLGVSASLVQERIALQRLDAPGRVAFEDGRFSLAVAREICRAPLALIPRLVGYLADYKKFPIERHPREYAAPMQQADVLLLLDSLSAQLFRAPFLLADETLLPLKTDAMGERLEGGACDGCVFNSQTAGGKEAAQRPAQCANKKCYTQKVERFTAAALVQAREEGATILGDSTAKQLFTKGLGGVNPDYVELNAELLDEEKAPGVKRITWAKVLSDATGRVIAPFVAAVDDRGNVRKFVKRDVALLAAEKTGHLGLLSIASGRGISLDKRDRDAAEKERRTKELAAQKMRSETSFAIASEISCWVEEEGLSAAMWPLLLPILVYVVGPAGVEYVCRRRGCADSDALLTSAAALSTSAQQALAVELIAADDLEACASRPGGPFFSDMMRPLLQYFDVSTKDCEASAKAKLAAKSPRKNAQNAKN